MTDKPLVPFTSPLTILSHLGISNFTGDVLNILLGFVFVVWLFYTLVAIYHWARYSHASTVAYPAIFVHLVVSFLIMAFVIL
jgi:hypothetical protein